MVQNVTVTGTGTSALTLSGRVAGGATVGVSTQAANVVLSGGAGVGYLGVGSGTTTLTGPTAFNFSSTTGSGTGTPVEDGNGNPTGGAVPVPTTALSAGTVAGQSGTLILDGATVTSNGLGNLNVYAGNGGDGTIIIRNNGVLNNNNPSASTFGRFGTFVGNGQIRVESGGQVSTNLIEMGRGLSTSSLTVTGTGSTVTGQQLVIGRDISNIFTTGTSTTTVTVADGGTMNISVRNTNAPVGGVIFFGGANTQSTLNVNGGGTVNFTGQLQLALSSAVLGPGTATVNVDGAGANLNVNRLLDDAGVAIGAGNGVVFASSDPSRTANINVRNGGRFSAASIQHSFQGQPGGPMNINIESGGQMSLINGIFLGLGNDSAASLVVDNGSMIVNPDRNGFGFIDSGFGNNTTNTITLRNSASVSVLATSTTAGSGEISLSSTSGSSTVVNIQSGSSLTTEGSVFISSALGTAATVNVTGGSTFGARLDMVIASNGADATGNATVNLSGNSTLNGRFLVVSSQGSLTATDSTINAGIVDDLGTLPGLVGNIAINGTSQLNVVGSNTSTNTFVGDYSGIISGSGSVTVNGINAFQVLRGANTYTGPTAVNVGTLSVQANVTPAWPVRWAMRARPW